MRVGWKVNVEPSSVGNVGCRTELTNAKRFGKSACHKFGAKRLNKTGRVARLMASPMPASGTGCRHAHECRSARKRSRYAVDTAAKALSALFGTSAA